MNERILELAFEANKDLDGNVPIGFAEKFAELIVAECMTMCDELQSQYFTSRKGTTDFGEKNRYAEGEAACYIIKYKLKKQFGVQE